MGIGETVEKLEPLCTARGMQHGAAAAESSVESPQKNTPQYSSNSTLARCPAAGSRDSPVDPQGPEQGPEGTSVSVRCLTAVNPGVKTADDQQGPEERLKTTTPECINGQESETAPSHTASLPTAYSVALSAPKQEQNLTSRSDRRGQRTVPASTEETGDDNRVTKSRQQDGLQVTVSSEENLCDRGSKESPSNAVGRLGLKTNLKPEVFVPSEEEKNHEMPAPPGSSGGRKLSGTVELQREPSLAIESPNVENAGSETTEIHGKFYSKEEISNGGKDNTETIRCHSVEANPKEVEEEERHVPKRKRKKQYLSSEDELDDTPDVLDSKIETAQRQCSGTEPQDTKEENSGDLEELSKASSKTDSTASRAMEEKDESSSSEAAGEKAEQNDDDTVKSQEDQPVIIKRKRGRPRKHPVETLKTKDDCKTDAGLVTVEQSPPGGKLKVMQTDEANKETPNLQERSGSNDDSEEKSVASVRRRGRKPKRSLTLSDDAESSEPERKRQKSVSEATEDKKDQESEEEEEEDEDEEPSGATTRSSTRSEAQRWKAQLSPSAKRKREASPPGARTRGQQRVEETPVKKAKR
nr:biorientation of chromosomes in cell division protein 1-like 1 [Ovis aries]